MTKRVTTFDQAMALNPTLSYRASLELLTEIHTSNEIYWRCYSEDLGADIDRIANRFLYNHAKLSKAPLPHIYNRADQPLQVFYFETDDGVIYKGAFYVNGALVKIVEDNEASRHVFIENHIARLHKYPDTGYTLPDVVGDTDGQEESEETIQD